MSAGFDVDVFGNKGGETTKQCAVVSIYEDLGGRDLLLQLCDSLVWKFKSDLDFQFDWWRFKYLVDPEIAMEGAQKAAQADLILLAPQSPDLPVHVLEWFEGWLPNRKTSAGALVLVRPSPQEASLSPPLGTFLRMAAQRANLDYLLLSSPGTVAGVDGKTAGISLFQPEMNELLADNDRPMHWGINE